MKSVGAYIFLCTLLSCIVLIRAAPVSHLVDKLPGQPEVGFKQYAGYVTVNATAGRSLFYYFAEADLNSDSGNSSTRPADYPVTLWLEGGPGCSSIGGQGGAFAKVGPFYPKSDGRGLQINSESWNKVSNMLFLESPAGVGWSYSNTSSDYSSFGDAATAMDSLKFLLGWLQLFPEYKHSDFYLSGESYAGHYVPQLASLILGYKGSDGFKFNLKGIALASPFLRLSVDIAANFDYFWSHGMISDVVYEDIVRSCDFEAFQVNFSSNVSGLALNVSEACHNYMAEAYNMVGDYVSPFDVIQDVCNTSFAQQDLILGRKVAHISIGADVCMPSEIAFYFNIPEVQKALHANVTNLNYTWSECSGILDYSLFSEDASIDILPLLKDLHMKGLRIWVFSGDEDSRVTLIGTRKLIRELAGDLNLSASIPYRAWYHKGQVGGWTIAYGKNLTYATVRGAGHMVQFTEPARALTLFKSFLADKSLPSIPV